MWTYKGRRTACWDGDLCAGHFVGDGSKITGISVAGDNLGNHLATQTVSGANLWMTGNVSGALIYGDGSNLTNIISSEVDPLWTAASGAINAHVASTAIHFTEASIDHTAIANIGTNTHAQVDTHLASTAIHFINTGFLTAETDPVWTAASAAYTELAIFEVASAAIITNKTDIDAVSSALNTEIDNTSGALQTKIDSVSAALIVNVADTVAVSAATIANYATINIVSGATIDNKTEINTVSSALKGEIDLASGALVTHAGDSTDPHGATLTQTTIAGTTVSAANIIGNTSVSGGLIYGDGSNLTGLAGGGGMTLIERRVFSPVASVSFSNISGYDFLYAVMGFEASDANYVVLRVNANSENIYNNTSMDNSTIYYGNAGSGCIVSNSDGAQGTHATALVGTRGKGSSGWHQITVTAAGKTSGEVGLRSSVTEGTPATVTSVQLDAHKGTISGAMNLYGFNDS